MKLTIVINLPKKRWLIVALIAESQLKLNNYWKLSSPGWKNFSLLLIYTYVWWLLKFIQLVSGGLNKFYIIINTFLCMMIIKYQWLLKFIEPASCRLDKFYIIIYIFSYTIITKDQWFLKIILFTSGRQDFYSFYCRFSIVVTPPEVGWIFIAFTIEPQLFSTRLLNKFYIIIYIFLCIKITKY